MTTAVMEHSGEGPRAVSRAIVLTLNCPNAAKWLTSTNPLLSVVFDLKRVHTTINPSFVYQQRVIRDKVLFHELSDKFIDTTPRRLKELLRTDGWLAQELRSLVFRRFQRTIRNDADRQFVLWILIEKDLLGEDSLLPAVLSDLFPKAALFSTPAEGGRATRIHFTSPTCKTCGSAMSVAGSAFVCQSCGWTASLARSRFTAEDPSPRGRGGAEEE